MHPAVPLSVQSVQPVEANCPGAPRPAFVRRGGSQASGPRGRRGVGLRAVPLMRPSARSCSGRTMRRSPLFGRARRFSRVPRKPCRGSRSGRAKSPSATSFWDLVPDHAAAKSPSGHAQQCFSSVYHTASVGGHRQLVGRGDGGERGLNWGLNLVFTRCLVCLLDQSQ